MEITVQPTLTGIHPRSEGLVQATRDFDRGRTDAKALAEVRRRDAQALVDTQVKAGFTHVSDGLLGFQDVFRPFAERVKGAKVGPITRWFDNNTFYRQPIIEGPLKRTQPILEPYLQKVKVPQGHTLKAVLPGPYTFAKLVDDKSYGSTSKHLTTFAREALGPELKWLAKEGYGWVQFNEPALVRDRPLPEEWEALGNAYMALLQNSSLTSTVSTYFGDASRILSELFELPVDYVGLDFTETALEALQEFAPSRGIQAGLVDGRSSIIEKPAELAAAANELLEAADVPSLVLAPTCDLEFLPRGVADEKVLSLGLAAAAVKEASA
jgi:5-methyltetrahydropteroyltriglutamate--homocysteine methyltransferase